MMLQEKYGMSAEVIDARSLVPFDYEPVLESVKKTGRLVVVTDACERGSYANEVASNVTRNGFRRLGCAAGRGGRAATGSRPRMNWKKPSSRSRPGSWMRSTPRSCR